MLTVRRALLVLSVAGLLAPATASAADQLSVDIEVSRFVERGGEVVALGRASARQTGGANASGAQIPVTEERQVRLQVDQSGSSCRVLALNLKDLYLQLLGLQVDASEINLHITGQRSGGALGKLFCRLASGLKLGDVVATKAAVRSLNRRLDDRPMRLLAFRSRIAPTAESRQAAPGTCEVLDLLLGPLNIDLLGLVVDLYGPSKTEPVRVHVIADPSKGVLGQSFCQLASPQPAT
jgi:hypothetical protein